MITAPVLQRRNIVTSQLRGIASAEYVEASATSKHGNFVTSALQIFWQPSPQHRNIATSWLWLSRFFDNPLRNIEASQLRDFGSPDFLTTLSATSKHRNFVTLAPQIFWQTSPQHRNIATSWLWLSIFFDNPLRNIETSQLRDFGWLADSCKISNCKIRQL